MCNESVCSSISESVNDGRSTELSDEDVSPRVSSPLDDKEQTVNKVKTAKTTIEGQTSESAGRPKPSIVVIEWMNNDVTDGGSNSDDDDSE